MTKATELVELAELLAEELHHQADERQQRAINARQQTPHIAKEEADAWALSFSTSYQVLRGIALALDEATDRFRASSRGDGAETPNPHHPGVKT